MHKYHSKLGKWTALLLCLSFVACNTTKRVKDGEHLLVSNKLKIKSDRTITNKGVLQEQLEILVVQKPNTYWSGIFPFKLWRYNLRSQKYIYNPQLDLPKSMEKPVLYDSSLQMRSAANMRRFLENQGYFNAVVTDTVKLFRKKATAYYNVKTGLNYLIDKISTDIDDSTINAIVNKKLPLSLFKNETPYTKTLADEERSRLINLLQNNGYYKFSQENISFELDTFNKAKQNEAEGFVSSAINLLTLQKKLKKQSLDIKIIIRENADPTSYLKYSVGKVIVFPDYTSQDMARSTTLVNKVLDSVIYRYQNYYVRESILNKQIFLRPGELYSRQNHEATISKLNELGIFQLVNVYFVEDTISPNAHLLNCYITLSPAQKLNATASLEVANATTYILGNSLGLSYRDRNFFRGANQLTISATGGIEVGSDSTIGETYTDHLFLQSTNIGLTGTISFPKFISPFTPKWMNPRALPRTQVNLGVNILDRINQFRLTNISSSFAYNWRQTKTKTWDFAPAFANIVLPQIRPAFQLRLDSNTFLRNSYRRTFIEGEQLAFTYTDQDQKQNKNYNYIRIAFEEAGLLMQGINSVQKNLSNGSSFIFDQYTKIDLDARRYFNTRHSLMALRFLAGIGTPYGGARTLPYIKQYFVGGPYSIRGWRPRTLGPKALKDSSTTTIDLTGDIKLEMSAEYRFDMIQLFSGTLNLNGALFADAGNIWLAKPDNEYLNGGQLDISRLGQDIAMSTGAGLRVIVASFFTIRLDAAFPIKNPYNLSNNGWILKQVDLGNSSWRKDNVVINLAIGMPF